MHNSMKESGFGHGGGPRAPPAGRGATLWGRPACPLWAPPPDADWWAAAVTLSGKAGSPQPEVLNRKFVARRGKNTEA